jgi:hypothetical protein
MAVRTLRFAVALAGFCFTASIVAIGASPPASDYRAEQAAADNATCPGPGWTDVLKDLLKPGATFPTQNTPVGAPDCNFHEWSWEAFVWATALDSNKVPRFLSLPTMEDLFAKTPPKGGRMLTLGTRGAHAQGAFIEGAGAIVEADGNMLVAPNGYPIYASVHM